MPAIPKLPEGVSIVSGPDSEGYHLAFDSNGAWWYHVDANGDPVYKTKYMAARGFVEGRAMVSLNGLSIHIKPDGFRAYNATHVSMGDFENGEALVHTSKGAFYIDRDGNFVRPSR